MYYLNYNSIAEKKHCQGVSRLTGSSYFCHDGKKITKKSVRHTCKEISGKIYEDYLDSLQFCEDFGIKRSYKSISEYPFDGMRYAEAFRQYTELRTLFDLKAPPSIRSYSLNKSKVRKKISALCRLRAARSFVAFYSISFPEKADDDTLYKIFNKWLTNCRTRYGLTTYLWVAERQKNGTLHFHMLTTNRMNIQRVNKAMAAAIDNEVKKGNIKWNKSSYEKYNGVDVDSPQQPKKRQGESRKDYRKRIKARGAATTQNIIKWIGGYLTKYITKNDIKFSHLPYHSSRDVSALFTTLCIEDEYISEFVEKLTDDADKYKIVENDHIIISVFKFTPDEQLFKWINKANENIYNYFQEIRKRE